MLRCGTSSSAAPTRRRFALRTSRSCSPPRAGTFVFIADPCGIDQLTSGSSTRAANCAAALDGPRHQSGGHCNSSRRSTDSRRRIRAILGSVGGNPNLIEETAQTPGRLGVVLRPRFIPGLNVAFDWYNIKLTRRDQPRRRRTELDQPLLRSADASTTSICDAMSRDEDSGYHQRASISGPQNVANFRTEGLDVTINYRFTPSRKLRHLQPEDQRRLSEAARVHLDAGRRGG